MKAYCHTRGLTLIELLITVAVFVTIFTGLFGIVQYTSKLILNSSMKLTALSLANDRMEYFRSLPYNDVGTISGIPPGTIPQNSTSTINGTVFVERVLVEYVDDPADGVLTATTTDSNGIPSDYKRIKVEISWDVNTQINGSIFLVSNIVPRSIETTVGGGSVRINVIDENSVPLPGAVVRLINASTTPPIDVSRFSDVSGIALFSGAPAASNYQVIVTGDGYSTDQTYAVSPTIPIPTTAPFTVLEADISTLTFQVDELGAIEVRTLASVTEDFVSELFVDAAGVATTTDTVVVSDQLQLRDVSGTFVSYGIAFLQALVPTPLTSWQKIVVIADTPVATSYRVQLYTGTTTAYNLIPDSALPGNGAGFTDTIIDISSLDATTYPDITVGLLLETSDGSVSPLIDEVSVYYRESEALRTSEVVTIKGNKKVGTLGDATPIPKYSADVTTDSSGEATLTGMEFDTYQVTIVDNSLRTALSCDTIPLIHRAGATTTLELVIVASTTHSVRVLVTDQTGAPLPGAEVALSRTGYADTQFTNACGQVYFDSLIEVSDYLLEITRTGYDLITLSDYGVQNEGAVTVTLTRQ